MKNTETVKEQAGIKLCIGYDEWAESPREWDNLGTMACFHSRYILGDKHSLSIEEVKDITESSDYLSLPLYLYDHGGISIRTRSFPCLFDSGQVGVIFVSRDKLKTEHLAHKTDAEIYEYLSNEVKIYDQYLNGDNYFYQIEDQFGNCLDSCSGFIGKESAIDDGTSLFKHYVAQAVEALSSKL